MIFDILTLFPNICISPLTESILARAIKKKLIAINVVNLRDFATNKHKTCDDYPFGGGPGMILKPEPIFKAVAYLTQRLSSQQKKKICTVVLSAKGKLFTQAKARSCAKQYERIILICGHYEGIDERVINFLADFELSIGRYVLTGGELPALVLVDAIARLIPGVVGSQESLVEESYTTKNCKEYPQYTRPAQYKGMSVPKILLSGNHKKIAQWRKKQQK